MPKFEKSRLSFKNKVVFESDFSPNVNRCFCVVAKMLFNNRINVDGTIDVDQAAFLRKYEVWSYIYYLYYYNNSVVEEFAGMRDPLNGKASAYRMYEQVRLIVRSPYIPEEGIAPFDVNSLVYFINFMIAKYGLNMMNPVVSYLQQLVSNRSAIQKLESITLVTGRPPYDVEIVNDPEKIANANVKVRVIEKQT